MFKEACWNFSLKRIITDAGTVFNSLICCSNRVETCFKISLTFSHTFWDSSGELKSLSLLIVQADGNQFFEGLYMYLWYAFRTQSSKYFFSRIADSQVARARPMLSKDIWRGVQVSIISSYTKYFSITALGMSTYTLNFRISS